MAGALGGRGTRTKAPHPGLTLSIPSASSVFRLPPLPPPSFSPTSNPLNPASKVSPCHQRGDQAGGGTGRRRFLDPISRRLSHATRLLSERAFRFGRPVGTPFPPHPPWHLHRGSQYVSGPLGSGCPGGISTRNGAGRRSVGVSVLASSACARPSHSHAHRVSDAAPSPPRPPFLSLRCVPLFFFSSLRRPASRLGQVSRRARREDGERFRELARLGDEDLSAQRPDGRGEDPLFLPPLFVAWLRRGSESERASERERLVERALSLSLALSRSLSLNHSPHPSLPFIHSQRLASCPSWPWLHRRLRRLPRHLRGRG